MATISHETNIISEYGERLHWLNSPIFDIQSLYGLALAKHIREVADNGTANFQGIFRFFQK